MIEDMAGMPTVASPPEHRVLLRNVSWETYERLLEEHLDCASPRLTYDRGVLEIMSPSAEHEWYKELFSDLIKLLTRELRIDALCLGSTTFRWSAASRGFEPDSCFYITNVRQVRGKERINLAIDPSPDIVVEVVVTHPSVSKLPICAELGVPEIWSYDGSHLRIYGLRGSEYIEMPASGILPQLGARQLSDFLELGKTMDSVAWPDEVLKRFRQIHPKIAPGEEHS
jgi:Uma2 family endonuclease